MLFISLCWHRCVTSSEIAFFVSARCAFTFADVESCGRCTEKSYFYVLCLSLPACYTSRPECGGTRASLLLCNCFLLSEKKKQCAANLPRKVPLKSKSHFSTVQTVKRVQISSIDTAFWPYFSFGLIIPDTLLRLTVHRITVSSCQLCHVSSFGSDWSWHPRCVRPIALSPSSAEKKSKVVVQYWTKERL